MKKIRDWDSETGKLLTLSSRGRIRRLVTVSKVPLISVHLNCKFLFSLLKGLFGRISASIFLIKKLP